jgi:hypothetical protein
MTRAGRLILFILIGFLGVLAAPTVTSAQRQQLPADEGQAPQGLPPREVQQLLDGYAVIQGQQFLGLTDAQFAQFLPKFRALQETRRRNEMERLRLLMELNRMTNARNNAQIPESDVRDRLRMLKEVESRSVSEIQKARDVLDQTLDLRQQARFRVFEEQIEQRKLQLLMQVRQNRGNRPLNRPQQQQQQ